MKIYFRLILASLVALLVSTSANAQRVSIILDSIYYYLDTSAKTAEVRKSSSYKSYSGSVVIPDSVIFRNETYSVTSIESYAFRGCTGLTSVSIPESVTSIGDAAFMGCTGLTDPVYNSKVFAYMPASYEGAYTIPSTIETICGSAFYKCTGLTSITIPEGVTSIGGKAFYDCKGELILYSDIPDGNVNSSSGTPLGDSKFTSIKMYGKQIGDGAFWRLSTIETIALGENVTSIGYYAFYGCTGLTSITIPESVTSIGFDAFYGCTGLTKAEFASIEQMCSIEFGRNTSPNASYQYSNPLLYAHNLYIDGKEITEVIIPKSVTTIGNNAFYGCSGLTSITIHEGVTSIGEGAFEGCTGIKTVNALSAVPPTAFSNSFSGAYSSAFLYVPIGSEEAYGTAEGWNRFAKLREKDFGMKDCLLTLKGLNGGSVALKCKTMSTYAFQITAEEGWKVSSMTFNGTDVTADIKDGQYTTPSLAGDSELSIVFEQEGNAVESFTDDEQIRVRANASHLIIDNGGATEQAAIYTTDGKLAKNIEAAHGTTQIRLTEGQVYLVKIGQRTFKVAM